MNLEKLTQFIHEDLKYKSDIRVLSYRIYKGWIHLNFGNMGEIVKLERYLSWINEKREDKLNQIWKK